MRVIEDIVNQGHGPLDPSYLFVHSTANPGATAKNHRDFYADGDWDFAVQYVCDWTGAVYHCVPDDRLAWAVGSGNKYGVNLEICEGETRQQFDGSWQTAVEFCAWYLDKRGWPLDRMLSHDECRLKWGGTSHTDPIPYFRKWGRTWDDFKQAVRAAMTEESDLQSISIPTGTYNVYRLYNPNNGHHMYTSGVNERDGLVKAGWKDEGVAWKAPDTGSIVYRMYNPNDGSHMFTINFGEANALSKAGWRYEGANFSSARDGIPVYRLYNPNGGDHFFTTSTKERDSLVKAGWKDEGTAFRAVG